MKTNEEIVGKIREMIEEEGEKIDGLTSVLNQLEGRGEPEKTEKAKRQWMLHFGAWSALLDLYRFATEDRKGGEAMENSELTPAELCDVRTLISILREVVGEGDVMMIAAIVSEEAELAMGNTDLPTVRQLAHELIGLAERALEALGGE